MRKLTTQQQSWLDLAKEHQVVFSSGSGHFSPFIEGTDITDLVLTFAAAVAAQTPVEKPWYPDDSGLWVEVPQSSMGLPAELEAHTAVSVLIGYERESRNYSECSDPASDWVWDHVSGSNRRIVAYRVLGAK